MQPSDLHSRAPGFRQHAYHMSICKEQACLPGSGSGSAPGALSQRLQQEGIFTLRDMKRNKHLAGTLFNILFNLNKFVAFETRDPFTIRQVGPPPSPQP